MAVKQWYSNIPKIPKVFTKAVTG